MVFIPQTRRRANSGGATGNEVRKLNREFFGPSSPWQQLRARLAAREAEHTRLPLPLTAKELADDVERTLQGEKARAFYPTA